MSLDVFLSFRTQEMSKAPKHTTFSISNFGNPRLRERLREITGDYGRLREIEWRFRGTYTE